ncbi:MAG: hypothetical protein AB1505_34435 [Candidatus Latescibacterota bacterium]
MPFPSLARRALEHRELPGRGPEWLARLFAELTFSHILELSRIGDLPTRAFYQIDALHPSGTGRGGQQALHVCQARAARSEQPTPVGRGHTGVGGLRQGHGAGTRLAVHGEGRSHSQ